MSTPTPVSANLITIDLTDAQSVAAAIKDGITTPELLHQVIDDSELVDDCLVLPADTATWHADDGNAEVEYETDSARDACEQYVADGDWSGGEDESRTSWVTVSAWRRGIDDAGKIVQVGKETYTIEIEAREPKCTGDDGHDWQDAGVIGHGGGVICSYWCKNCGCGKDHDTWAQNPANGEQGLNATTYTPGQYAEKLAALEDESEESND